MHKRKAFSIIELIMILVAVSCVMAAMAPVLTIKAQKKPKQEIYSTKGVLYTYNIGGDCVSSAKYQNVAECKFIVPDKVTKVSALIVGGGGGGAGASFPVVKNNLEQNITSGDFNFNITKELRNVKIANFSKAGIKTPYIADYKIPNNVIYNSIGGKIKLHIAKNKKISGVDDFISSVEVYDKQNNLNWGMYLDNPDDTKDYSYNLSNACEIYEYGARKKTSCSKIYETEVQNNIKIKYENVFAPASGSGGGGGARVLVKDINVASNQEYTIGVGKGGSAGLSGSSGEDGAISYVNFGSLYIAQGGKKGLVGESAKSATETPVLKDGGAGGEYETNAVNIDNIETTFGEAGSKGSIGNLQIIGGIGGLSGLKNRPGCGGFFLDSSICYNSNVSGLTQDEKFPNIIYDGIEEGQAGAGGGGGGFSFNVTTFPSPGNGSRGQDGYVFLYWQEAEEE